MRGDIMEVWQTPKQSWPALITGVLIRWRVELLTLGVLCTYMLWLHLQTDDDWVIQAAVLGPVAVVFLLPWSRRFVVSRFWCVMDRHRLRTCLRMAKIRTMNLDGALPFMLWARPTMTGERVWVWLRAGSSADDLEAVLGYIAPSCYAREARLHRSRLSTLVAVELIRRDPLGKTKAIDSPFATVIQWVRGQAAEGTEPITAATVVPLPVSSAGRSSDTPTPPVKSARTARTSTNTPRDTAAASRPAVVVGGEDLSDYID